LETKKSNTFNQRETRNENGDSVEQILTGQRGFGKQQVEIISLLVSTLAVFQRKRGWENV
jgi:hypothetical protein